MNRHSAPIVDMDFTDDQMILISLSDRIIVTDMQQTKIVVDINLPTLNEPYLNSTTLPEISYTFDNEKNENSSSSDDASDKCKKFHFLVNSLHHIYLVSAHESIKFERSSTIGYSIVKILDKKRAVCIIAEFNGNSVECWDIVRNRLIDRIDFPKSIVKDVFCIQSYSMIVTVLEDGTIHFHSMTDWTKSLFVHRGTIYAGPHLHLVVVDNEMLIATFDVNVSTDFVIINLKQFHDSEQILSDDQVIKTLITFDPSIRPKPIKNIILPDKETMNKTENIENFPLFICQTNTSIFVVHKCDKTNISYIRIDGQFDR